MAKRISILVLFGILVISVWVLGSAIQAGAETMNYKSYGYVTSLRGKYIPKKKGRGIKSVRLC